MKAFLSAFSPVANFRHLFIRPSSNLPVLDGFRALSMLLVIVFHTCTIYASVQPEVELIDMIDQGGWLRAWVWNGDKGVDIFFVISGFLITGILLRQIDRDGRIQFGNFYWRRFLRLSPAYWFVLLIYVLLGLPNVNNAWANLLYVNNFLHYEDQAMNWSWSLAIEEQFYLIYPLILMLLVNNTKNPLRWMWVLFGLSFVIRFAIIMLDERIRTTPGSVIAMDAEYHAYHFSVLYDNLYTRYGALLCGCIAAYYYFHHEASLRQFLNSGLGKVFEFLSFFTILFVMCMPVLSRQFDGQTELGVIYQTFSRNIFCGAVAYLALVCLEQGYLSRFLNLIFSNRIWYPLAQLSYSMYLVHVFPIAVLVQNAVPAMAKYPEQYDYTHWEAMALIALYGTGLTFVLALIIYMVIERPIMNLRK